MPTTYYQYAKTRFKKSYSLNGRPLRLLHKAFPDRWWVLRAVEINGKLYAIFWHRYTGTEIRVRWNYPNNDSNPQCKFNGIVYSIANCSIFSREDNGFYGSGAWSRIRGSPHVGLQDTDEKNGGFDSIEAMMYAMKDDGYIYEGPEYPNVPMMPQWTRPDPCWHDEDATGGWGRLVRLYEDNR